ncbi:hypothetical protein SSABA_v1c03640 [Spiroplasma sabaudiense Ar-1343]|uniref:Lipoprotein n=1 Tax=Spiroplasma sabaudiense Ar-1343 TaxID=1276257 RepID=W6A9H1_9MOLU|nr:hypothetical protein [Spiroplasma sabaudiense]AHI53773.1 hypothetical protein SSABA_v1c03640 [Spiroplasma sabaudiense Ar-1343]
MKKIIKIMAGIFPVLTATQTVAACADFRSDISNWLIDGDLGYVENLDSTTIMKAFIEKNPEAVSDALYFSGSSYRGLFVVNERYRRVYKGTIAITYHSKIAYKEPGVDENIECQLNDFDDVCNVDLNILDPVGHPLTEEDNYKFFIHKSSIIVANEPEIAQQDQMRWQFSLRNEGNINIEDSYWVGFRWYDVFLFRLTIIVK